MKVVPFVCLIEFDLGPLSPQQQIKIEEDDVGPSYHSNSFVEEEFVMPKEEDNWPSTSHNYVSCSVDSTPSDDVKMEPQDNEEILEKTIKEEDVDDLGTNDLSRCYSHDGTKPSTSVCLIPNSQKYNISKV